MTADIRVEGSGNIVMVAGRDLIITAPVGPPAVDDRRNLLNLLGLVRRFWITHVLERSVSHAALLGPRVRMEPDAVAAPWRRYHDAAAPPGELPPPDKSIGEVFGAVGQTLLILGEPGAGKTITLLALAREFIERAERDPSAPVPVVLNLSSWTGSRSFHDWLVGELAKGYFVGQAFSRRWLAEHRLLLLLDGLDEVGEDRRAGCVQALHAFVEEHGVAGLVVCCRSREYAELPVRLRLGAAVRVLPLEPAQVDAYLDAAGPALAGLRDALAANEELSRLAESPLMLSIMTLAFRGLAADALGFDERATREELREEIFGRFVDRMFTLRERPDDGFSRGRVEAGLRWLASGMMARGSMFAVELLQPEWLTSRQLLPYAIASRVGGATVVTLAIGAVAYLGCLALVLAGGATASQRAALTGARAAGSTLAAALGMGLAAGLLYAAFGLYTLRRSTGTRREPGMAEELGLFFGYLALSGLGALLITDIGWLGFGFSLRELSPVVAFITIWFSALALPLVFARKGGRGSLDRDISLAGTLAWRWKTAVELALVSTLSGGVVVTLAPWFGTTRPAAGAMFLIVTFTLMMYGSWRQEVPPVDRWRQGEGNSALRNSWKIFAAAGVACVLALFPLLAFVVGMGLSPWSSFMLAVLVAIVLFTPALFWFGGIDLLLHAALRMVLAFTGTMPLRLRRFLDYALHLGFLQRVGGGYIFFHRLLLEHFAARPAPDGGSAATTHALRYVHPAG